MADESSIAPADARPHPHWPLWRVVLAYLLLLALALFSIWGIDRRAMRLMNQVPAASSLQ